MLARALVPLLPHEPLVKLLNSQPKPIVFMIVRQGSMMMVSLSFITITIPALRKTYLKLDNLRGFNLIWHTLRLKALALLNSEYPCNSMMTQGQGRPSRTSFNHRGSRPPSSSRQSSGELSPSSQLESSMSVHNH